jgi:uncharacterized protein YbjT (DUF2867 family)
MRIVVFGATGSTGRHVVDQSLFAGHDVTAVVRRPDQRPTEQLIERLNCRGHAAGGWASAAADCLRRQRLRRSSRLLAKPW